MRIIFIFVFLSSSCFGLAHEGHEEKRVLAESVQSEVEENSQQGRPTSWIRWAGSFHLIFLHFPIALINMLVVSELLLAWYKKPIFEFSSRFLIISAALFAPPTALLGLIYSYSAPYGGLMERLLFWHMWFGILTAAFAIVLAYVRTQLGCSRFYCICLLLLFLFVNMAGFFGGAMTFGLYQMFPPL